MEEEIIALDLDISGAVENLEELSESMDALRSVVSEIGDMILKAIAPAIKCFGQLQKSVDGLNGTLSKSTSALQAFGEQVSGMQLGEAAAEEVSAVAEMAQGLAETAAGAVITFGVEKMIVPVSAAIKEFLAGITLKLGISTGAFVGIVGAVAVAVAAAVAAIIIYWDEIAAFFTQTIPQLWAQFTQWIGNMGGARAEFGSDAGAVLGSVGTTVSAVSMKKGTAKTARRGYSLPRFYIHRLSTHI